MEKQSNYPATDSSLRIAVVACAVMEIELEHYCQGMDHIVHVEMMEQGLHNDPPLLSNQLQQAVGRVEQRVLDLDAIVLVYGLCSRGTENVRAKNCKLVMARAHDCITLLLGSKERYAQYIKDHPGTYWYSPGWNKHHIPPGKERYEKLYAAYVQKYGQDNAEYLMESEQHWFSTYDRAAYVDLTVGATPQDKQYTQDCADWLKWDYAHESGDPQLFIDLLLGRWDDQRFLVLEPGESLELSGDDRVIRTASSS